MIILMLGSQGSGKTLFLTKKGYEAYKAGRTVYTNYEVGYPHKILEFEDLMECKLNNAIVLLDEAHLWGLDAREAMSKKNRSLVKQFIVQVRKQGVDLIVATQFIRQIDVRVRDNAEFYGFVRKYVYDSVNKNVFEAVQSQKYGSDVPIIIEVEFYKVEDGKTARYRFLANDVYDLYDTHEVIRMVETDEEKLKRINNKKKLERLNE